FSPDDERGDHGGDTALRKMDVDDEIAPSDTKVDKPADLVDDTAMVVGTMPVDENAIVPSTFEPLALDEHTPRPQRPPRPEKAIRAEKTIPPEKTIPVSDFPDNRWGRIDLDDGMPRMEIREKNASRGLDLEGPVELLELADGPPAAAAASESEPPTTQTPALEAAGDEPTSDEESDEEKKIPKNVH